MFDLPRQLRKTCVVAGIAIMAVAAPAFFIDGQITIDRALNSPTLTIRYTNANASLVELRVNGESIATRTVNAGKNSGETTFSLDLSSLSPGVNHVEIRLFDRSGKLLASQTTDIQADSEQAPVFIKTPKVGATLQGNVNIKVGFGRQMSNSYVSFFIDNQFKSISNVPPFDFSWDTTKDPNGWHEVEAWVVDGSSETYKTSKVRVFVQNPGGRTERVFNTTKPAPAQPVAKPQTTPNAVKPSAQKVALAVKPKVVTPAVKAKPAATPVLAMENTVSNPIRVNASGASGTKPARLTPSTSMGPKQMLPTGERLAKVQSVPPIHVIKAGPTAVATGRIAITRGQRLPSIGTFAIVYNTEFVNFDVQPRVTDDGVPLTPFRYLIEKAGGKVDWQATLKNVTAKADGKSIFLHIGDDFAEINQQRIDLERPSFIDSGRTIVPLSFMKDALNVNIEYDKASGHVLITSIKK
ncbi:MAG TPA: stalk domain-containing protein [Fimbriimonadaceae bacterium]|nr:stalk domain-containing protein [Fimbriimonadaceae bacterium]